MQRLGCDRDDARVTSSGSLLPDGHPQFGWWKSGAAHSMGHEFWTVLRPTIEAQQALGHDLGQPDRGL